MPDLTDVQAMIDVAQEACEPTEILDADGQVIALFTTPTIVTRDGSLIDVEAFTHRLRPAPRRTQGTVTTRTPAAFAGYLTRHAQPCTEVWADDQVQTLIAVLNADTPTTPGWRDHRAILEPTPSTAWIAWASIDGVPMDPEEFAGFLHERAGDVGGTARETLADFARLAHGLKPQPEENRDGSRADSDQAVAQKPANDECSTSTSEPGIPSRFDVLLTPFVGGDTHLIHAHLAHHRTAGRPRLTVLLQSPVEVLADAFDDIVAAAAALIQQPIWDGTPADPAT